MLPRVSLFGAVRCGAVRCSVLRLRLRLRLRLGLGLRLGLRVRVRANTLGAYVQERLVVACGDKYGPLTLDP